MHFSIRITVQQGTDTCTGNYNACCTAFRKFLKGFVGTSQAADAQSAGKSEIMRLLHQPDDLLYLADIRADYEAKQHANKTQLSATVVSQARWLPQSCACTMPEALSSLSTCGGL